jgi:aminoglycoside 6'-N-acetyltransferase
MNTLFSNDGLEIRILSEADAPLLVKWLSNPQVLQYYEGRDNPHTLELVYKHFFEGQDEEIRCIVNYDGKDIGYIQFYQLSDEEYELYGYSTDEIVFGMDQFIGETDYWNQGIGTRLVKSVCEYLVTLGADRIVMDPQAWNHRALRVYEKCGFRKVRVLPEHEWHEGKKNDCWLIEFRVRVKGESSD